MRAVLRAPAAGHGSLRVVAAGHGDLQDGRGAPEVSRKVVRGVDGGLVRRSVAGRRQCSSELGHSEWRERKETNRIVFFRYGVA